MSGSSPVLWASVLTAIMHARAFCCSPRVLGREIQPVRAGIDLEKTAVLPCLLDDPLDVDFVAGTLEQQASRRMSQDIEVPVIHGAQDALGLLLPVKSEARMNRADRIVEFPQEVVGIVERSVRENIHFG